jgi:hypothetical protein
VLGDHKRVGKRFIPPVIATLGELSEVAWIDDILPELLWLGILNDAYGLKGGVQLAVSLAKSVRAVVGGYPRISLTSIYSDLSTDQWSTCIEAVGGH